MRTFAFTSTYHIEAATEKEAREKFANESMEFAASAEIDDITELEN